MYKTVRKGDASLQYTILPQTDQTHFSIPSSSPRKSPFTKNAIVIVMLIVMVALLTVALINQTYFTSTIFALPKKLIQNSITHSTVNVTNIPKERHKVTAKPTVHMSSTKGTNNISSTTPVILEEHNKKTTETVTETSSTLRNILRIPTVSAGKKNPVATSTAFSTQSSSSPTTTLPSTLLPKKSKLPRITLKLRENETVPQMYLKSGIASYTKGNMTTSVLAHGLSLEGLIFKTPEGTIKPWSPCISGPRRYLKCTHGRQITKAIHYVSALLLALLAITLILLWVQYYVRLKAVDKRDQNIEESESDQIDGDKSTLLKTENEENEEKEYTAKQ